MAGMKKEKALEVLGFNLSDKPSKQEIKEAYRKLALEYHPDKNRGNLEAVKKMQEVNEAYVLLRNAPKEKVDRFIDETFLDEIFKEKRQELDEVILSGEESIEELSNLVCRAACCDHMHFISKLLNSDLFEKYGKYTCLNIKDQHGETPLHYALKRGTYDTIKLLLNNGADPNIINNNGKSSLHYLFDCYLGVKLDSVLQSLLEKNANTNMQDKNGQTPLHRLCQYRYKLDLGFEFCEQKYTEHAKTLLRAGANPDIKDHYGKKPVDYTKYGSVIGRLLGAQSYKKAFYNSVIAIPLAYFGVGLFYALAVECSKASDNQALILDGKIIILLIATSLTVSSLWCTYSAVRAAFPKPSSEFFEARAEYLRSIPRQLL